MNVLFLTDQFVPNNTWIEKLRQGDMLRSSYDVAADTLVPPDSVIAIDLFLKFGDPEYQHYQNHGGIALVKLLRIIGIQQHIVLLSPWSLEELLRIDPSYFILASKGVTVAGYEYDAASLSLDWSHLSGIQAQSAEELRPYITAGRSLPKDERHNWANWWGIDRLWCTHRLLEAEDQRLERMLALDYPVVLRTQLKQLRNQEILFLHGHSENMLKGQIADQRDRVDQLAPQLPALQDALDELERVQGELENEIAIKGSTEAGIRHALDLVRALVPGASPSLARVVASQLTSAPSLASVIGERALLQEALQRNLANAASACQKYAAMHAEVEHGQSFLAAKQELTASIDNLRSHLYAVLREVKSEIRGKDIKQLQYDLKARHPRVLLIDDQADDGWGEIMQLVIHGGLTPESFKCLAPPTNTPIDETYFTEEVAPLLDAFDPQVILLDLRLQKEGGQQRDVTTLSGARMLSMIRAYTPGSPVVMTTASNKAWSVETLMQLGCDGYWIKEGVDLELDEENSAKNYSRLLELVLITTDEAFSRVLTFGKIIKEIELATEAFWWLDTSATKGVHGINKSAALALLNEGLFLQRDYLRIIKLQRQSSRPESAWFYPSLVIQHLGKIVEIVYHTFSKEGIAQTDRVGRDLFDMRNRASHAIQENHKPSADKLTEDDMFWFTKTLSKWLLNPPSVADLKTVGKIDLPPTKGGKSKR